MGYEDRDYMRSETPSIFSEFLPSGVACRWLIGAIVACYAAQHVALTMQRRQQPDLAVPAQLQQQLGVQDDVFGLELDDWITRTFSLDIEAVKRGQVWRLVTYAFLHCNQTNAALQILFSVMLLWWFGGAAEEHMGSREFLLFYLAAALGGGVLFFLAGLFAPAPISFVGATGAASAVALYCAFYLSNGVLMLAIIGVGVAFDSVLYPWRHKTSWSVFVHLGALGFAVAYYRCHLRLSSGVSMFTRNRRAQAKPRLPGAYPEDEPAPAKPAAPTKQPVPVAAAKPAALLVDEHLEAKLDAVLEKIARQGQHSLSESEQQTLKQASEIYRKRRP